MKRLEMGRFVRPSAKEGKVALTSAQMAMPDRGRCHRGTGTCAGTLHREPHRPAPPDKRLLRTVCPVAACRARPSGARPVGPVCWSASRPITCRCTARAGSSTAKGLTFTDPPWPVGSANPPPCGNRSPMPPAAMWFRPRPSSQTTRRSACWRPAPERRRLPGFGPAPETGARDGRQRPAPETGARDGRPWHGDAPPAASYRFAGDRKGRHPKDRLAASAVGCMPMVAPGSRICIAPVPSARSPAWPMSYQPALISTHAPICASQWI